MLDPQLVEQLAGHLEKVTTSVRLVATLDDGPKSAELDELLTEIAGLSDSITLDRNGNDTRRPSFSIERVGSDVAIRFAAVPLGHEFTSFVLWGGVFQGEVWSTCLCCMAICAVLVATFLSSRSATRWRRQGSRAG